jgi:hypothetical protein
MAGRVPWTLRGEHDEFAGTRVDSRAAAKFTATIERG